MTTSDKYRRTVHPHAAPWLRHRLCLLAHAIASPDRYASPAWAGEAYGILYALRTLASSADQNYVPGITGVESLPPGAVELALGLAAAHASPDLSAKRLMGLDVMTLNEAEALDLAYAELRASRQERASRFLEAHSFEQMDSA